MFNLDTLDTVIAMVVVLLVLSLIVQAIQGFIKKIFKLKSKEIEKSLIQLFQNVLDKPAPPPTAAPGALTDSANEDDAQKLKQDARGIVDQILSEFNKVGRTTKRGKTVLDSIAKEDLLKILTRIDSTHFYADYVAKFQEMYQDILALEQEIEKLLKNEPPLLQGAASAKFAEMQEVLAPLINDVKGIVEGQEVRKNAVFGDLLNLRRIKLDDALKLLAAAQDSIAADIKAEREAQSPPAAIKALQDLSASLSIIARLIGQLSQRMDAAFATLRAKLDHVETWYDTVMQSFDERYARHMKNVAIYISVVLVIYLNANFFRIYRDISSNDMQRAYVLEYGQKLADKLKATAASNDSAGSTANANSGTNANSATARNANAGRALNANNRSNVNAPDSNANTPDSNANTSGSNANTGNANSSTSVANANTAASGQPTPAPTPDVTVEDLKKQLHEIGELTASYEGFGFSPLTWQNVKDWVGRFIAPPSGGQWLDDRKHDLRALLGWAIMVLLLSVGAPFWQDTLESLFGVKNLLRKKSNTQNVEKESGAGQPKSS